VDNDILPAKLAGMVTVFLRRGPWGVIHARRPEAAQADIRIDSLAELRDALEARVGTCVHSNITGTSNLGEFSQTVP
jgi:hypothetical protein